MKSIALLVSPRARDAYFADYISVVQAELFWVSGINDAVHRQVGSMDFLEFEASSDSDISSLAQLSFVQGIFQLKGECLQPLQVAPEYALHEDFVYGSKYRGKTNEMLTQLLLNLGLASLGVERVGDVRLLDPMCGRGTTLLWAMRYGIKSRGIEQDARALGDMRQSIKKWCKVHRQKHQFNEGFIGKANKQDQGKFAEFSAADTSMRVIVGDSREVVGLLKGEKFHLLISDLPYGVQHFTTDKTRNPLAVLAACAPGWCDSLRPGGVMVLAFNRYLPKREELLAPFIEQGLQPLAFEAPHRMSESIVRDVVVLKKEVSR